MRKTTNFFLLPMTWLSKVFCMKYTGLVLAVFAIGPSVLSCFCESKWLLVISQVVIGFSLAVQSFISGRNAKREISDVHKRIDELGFRIIDSPEYLYAMVDAEDHVLFCVRTDGTIDWALGIPYPIKKELERLETKIEQSS